MRQPLDVREQVQPQLGQDALTGLLQNDGLKIGAYHGDHQNTGINRHINPKASQFKIPLHQPFNFPHQKRGDDVIGDRKHHQQANQQKLLGVGLGIGKQAADDFSVLHLPVKAQRLLFVLHQDVGQHKHQRKCADDGSHDQNRVIFTH